MVDIPYYRKRVIVAPLCWGLGHATRCVPIVDQLLQQECEVAIASDSEALQFLRNEYPQLESFAIAPYAVHYRYGSMAVNMALQATKLRTAVRAERADAAEIYRQWKPDVIISDNRLGFRATGAHNVYMSHQLQVLGGSRLGTAVASWLHRSYYQRFDELWVPDYEKGSTLAGILSETHALGQPIRYLGPLSRFEKLDVRKDIDILAVLSGPEPQRAYLEIALLEQLATLQGRYTVTIVRGTTAQSATAYPPSIVQYDLVQSLELNELMCRSRLVICRAGYSSIMDLAKLDTSAILVPTPGQHEQAYLALYLDGKYSFQQMLQAQLSTDLLIKIESLLIR